MRKSLMVFLVTALVAMAPAAMAIHLEGLYPGDTNVAHDNQVKMVPTPSGPAVPMVQVPAWGTTMATDPSAATTAEKASVDNLGKVLATGTTHTDSTALKTSADNIGAVLATGTTHTDSVAAKTSLDNVGALIASGTAHTDSASVKSAVDASGTLMSADILWSTTRIEASAAALKAAVDASATKMDSDLLWSTTRFEAAVASMVAAIQASELALSGSITGKLLVCSTCY